MVVDSSDAGVAGVNAGGVGNEVRVKHVLEVPVLLYHWNVSYHWSAWDHLQSAGVL